MVVLGLYSQPIHPAYPIVSKKPKRKSKLISPVPGSFRRGLSAICMCPMEIEVGLNRHGTVSFHDLHVVHVILDLQIGRIDVEQGCSRACLVLYGKNSGIFSVLIGSIKRFIDEPASRAAANRKFSTNVAYNSRWSRNPWARYRPGNSLANIPGP